MEPKATTSTSDEAPDSNISTHDRCGGASGVWTLVWRSGGSAAAWGAAPQLWTTHPREHPQNIPIRASKGMTCPNLREIGSGRGRGVSFVVFPAPLLLV